MPALSLTPAQRQLFALAGKAPDDPGYVCQVSISFGEAVDENALRAAWDSLANSALALRTVFGDPSGAPASVAAADSIDWTEIDWTTNPPEDPGGTWNELVSADAVLPVAVAGRAPSRFQLIRLPDGTGHALWTFHAAALDYGSVAAVLHLWLAIYDAARTGRDVPVLPEFPSVPAPDAEAVNREKSGWKAAFGDFERPRAFLLFPLPDSSADGSPRRARVQHVFERDDTALFLELQKEGGPSIGQLARIAWTLLLSRAVASERIVLVEPCGRADDEFGPTCAEPIAPRIHTVDESLTARRLAESPGNTGPGLPTLTVGEIADVVKIPARDVSGSAMFIIRDGDLNDILQRANPRWMSADFKLAAHPPHPVAAVVTPGDRPEFAISFETDALSNDAAVSLLERWVAITRELALRPDEPLESISLLLPGETEAEQAPDPPPAFGSLVTRTLHETFGDLARDFRNATALEAGARSLTFSELDTRANQLARHLKKRGVEPKSRVGLMVDRSANWVIALLAILKADAEVLLLDPAIHALSNPEPLRNLDVKRLVIDSASGDTDAFADFDLIALDKENAAILEQKPRAPQTTAALDDPAICWLDADSELVSCSHAGALQGLQALSELLDLNVGDRMLLFAPLAKSAAAEEAMATLFSGATLVIRADEIWPTRTAFQEFLAESHITALSIPTPFWSQWVHYLAELSVAPPPELRVVAVTGWRVLPGAAQAWHSLPNPPVLLTRRQFTGISMLAPLAGRIDGELSVGRQATPLGRPVGGVGVMIRSRSGRALPRGFAGELEIIGRNSRAPVKGCGSAFRGPDGMFHDRDTVEAAWAPPGRWNIPQAIELVAASHPEVFDCVAEIRGPENLACLWIVPSDTELGEPNGFRDFLREKLPEALVPSRIACLSRLVLASDGSIDSEALTTPEPDNVQTSQTGLSKTENDLRRILARALGNRKLAVDEMITDGRVKPAVAKHLHAAVAREGFDVVLADFESAFSIRSLLRTIRGRDAAPEGGWVPLAPLKPSGNRPPLILIHDLCGTAKIYESLVAAVDIQQPCYGLVAKGTAEPDSPHRSVDEMAAAYIDAIRAVDPDGPYHLAGFGFGGMLAFEIACRLGPEAVGLVAAIGTLPPVPSNNAVARVSAAFRNSIGGLLGKSNESRMTARQRRARDTPVFQLNLEAESKYEAGTFEPEVHLFIPESGYPPFRKAQSAWLEVAPDARFYQVPCARSEMLEEPAAAAIAEALSKLVAELEVETEDDGVD